MTKNDGPSRSGKKLEKILEFDPKREGGDGIMLHNINATNFILSPKVSSHNHRLDTCSRKQKVCSSSGVRNSA